jgi:hypothetical protein
MLSLLMKAGLIDSSIARNIGREYGYPECCIDFFLSDWVEMVDFDREHADAYTDRVHQTSWAYCGYIPCPSCLSLKENGKETPMTRQPDQMS